MTGKARTNSESTPFRGRSLTTGAPGTVRDQKGGFTLRVLVTGASGLAGQSILSALEAEPDWRTWALSRRSPPPAAAAKATWLSGDLLGPELPGLVAGVRPDAVIHAAAWADVDGCQRDPALAKRINLEATEALVGALGAIPEPPLLVYISTDYVFSGEQGPYGEMDAPSPINVYGESKLAGERAALTYEPAQVIRTAQLYGSGDGTRDNLVTWAARELRAGRTVPAASDEYGTPTLVQDLARYIVARIGDWAAERVGEEWSGVKFDEDRAAGRNPAGDRTRIPLWPPGRIIHCAGPDLVSRYEWALAVMEAIRVLEGSVSGSVEAVAGEALRRPAARPKQGGLRTEYSSLDPARTPLMEGIFEVLREVHGEVPGEVPGRSSGGGEGGRKR
ncbi:MAG: SDR family oxidoreductase [Firmicutes bacterium]|nr:SDR family oxidoreductase [Bacillota bacterium]